MRARVGRPPSPFGNVVILRLQERPATMRELCADLQVSMRAANVLLVNLRRRGAVQVLQYVSAPPAKRPVAVYAPAQRFATECRPPWLR